MRTRDSRTGVLRRRRSLETMEQRLLLAADIDLAPPLLPPVAAIVDSHEPAAVALDASAQDVAEGEPAPDLVAFAKALADSGAIFYGADWCPFCTDQKELFEDGETYLPFVEVTNPDRTLNEVGIAENITVFPTWEFADGSRLERFQTLEALSAASGIPIPTASAPSFVPIDEQVEVRAGSPLHIPIDAYDPNSNDLTITVTSSNPSVVSARVLQGNRSLRIDADNFGDMVFELFEGRAPEATGRLIELADAGFYDAANNDPPVTFHRVAANFVIQGGDPTGTGAGGSNLGDFDDDYHEELQHNRTGVLSFAKTADDTNDSQFFITDDETRFLDYNHSIAGQLVEGDDGRFAIQRTATTNSRPDIPVNILSVEVFEDTENGMVVLSAPHGVTGTSQVTVTVTDGEGLTASQTFTVNVVADPINTPPWLTTSDDIQGEINEPIDVQLDAIDIEDDDLVYTLTPLGGVAATIDTIDAATGQFRVTPPQNFTGTFEVQATVRGLLPDAGVNNDSGTDRQVLSINVSDTGPSGLDLSAASDTGASDTDNITNADTLEFIVSGVTSGSTVLLRENGVTLATATASSDSVTVTLDATALADGVHVLQAFEQVGGQISGGSPELNVTLDRAAPSFTSTPPSTGEVGQVYTYNAETDDDANLPVFSLVNRPDGAAINTTTGVVTWTPATSQSGRFEFQVEATDTAGNTVSQDVTVDVQGQGLVDLTLRAVDDQGAPLTEVLADQTFFVQLLTTDRRDVPQGVAAAYVDLLFDSSIVSVDGDITFGADFATGRSGTPGTGLVDELGATAVGGLGSGEFLIATVPMRALAVGDANLRTALADTDVELFGESGAVAEQDLNLGELEFDVIPPFRAVDDEFSINEDAGEQGLTVLANDTRDAGVNELTVVSVDVSAIGVTPVITAGGTLVSYTAPDDFNGEDTFTYRVSDGSGDTSEATVTVVVQSVNDPPLAVDDAFTGDERVAEDSSGNTLDVLANDDIAPDVNESLTITELGTPDSGGQVSIIGGGQLLSYTPAPDFDGTETFTYTVADGSGGQATATVTVEVSGTNDPPSAVNDSLTVVEDSSQAPLDVLFNDATDTGEVLRITTIQEVTDGATVTISEDGSRVLYTPSANFVGRASFVYTVSDGRGGVDSARVEVNVTDVNDPPTANDDPGAGPALNFGQNTGPHTIDVLANDSLNGDVNETLTITAVTPGSQNGVVAVSSDGQSVEYTPATGFLGTETFTYTVSDGTSTDTATVTVTVLDFVPASISGRAFIDGDGDGTFDAGESPIFGVAFELTGTDENGQSVSRTATSDPSGRYEFDNLVPGSYEVEQIQPSMLQDGSLDVGDDEATVVNSNRFSVELSDGQDVTENNFGEAGRDPSLFSMRDLFRSTRRNTGFSVLDATSNQVVAWLEGDWGTNPSVQVDSSDGMAEYQLSRNGQVVESGAFASEEPPSSQLVSHTNDGSGDVMVVRLTPSQRPVEFRNGEGSTAGGSGVVGRSASQIAEQDSGAEGESDPLAPQRVDAVFEQFRELNNANPEDREDIVGDPFTEF